jgi:hypothetical protein
VVVQNAQELIEASAREATGCGSHGVVPVPERGDVAVDRRGHQLELARASN